MYGDPKTLQRIRPQVQRVLIVDTHPAAAKLLMELLKGFGAMDVPVATSTARAWELVQDFEPQLILVELSGPGLDGLAFTRDLRRSRLPFRQTPVVVVGAEPTAEDIKATRDAGAHEFLCKPYTTKDLFRRVENVALRPRPWIEAKMYVGPDRRRFNSAEYHGARKRQADATEAAALAGLQRAAAAIRAQLPGFSQQPQTALRAMLEDAAELQHLSVLHNADLTAAVGCLNRYLLNALERSRLSPSILERHLAAVEALARKERLQPDARRQLLEELQRFAA